MADPRRKMHKVMETQFGNPLNSLRGQVVTVSAVDLSIGEAQITPGQGDASDTPVDPLDSVPWLDSYVPAVGDLAYIGKLEGAPVLLGRAEKETWRDLSLPTGYSTVAGWQRPQYRLEHGHVWFRGACNVAANNAAGTKFTLPSGYWPTQLRALAIPYSNGTAISGHLRFDMGLSGNMNTLVISPAATVFLMFEGVSMDVRAA